MKFVNAQMTVQDMEFVTVLNVSVHAIPDGVVLTAVSLTVVVNQVALGGVNAWKLILVALVEIVLLDGWVQHVMTHVFMESNNQWTVALVYVIHVGQEKVAIPYVWDMVHVMEINAFVTH